LDALPGISVMRDQLDINMVWCRLAPEVDTVALMAALTAHGIRANPPEHGMMRFVTHWQIDEADIATVAGAVEAGLTA
ncbi:MAG: threonine aldolase, partial [Microvirgula sp.]